MKEPLNIHGVMAWRSDPGQTIYPAAREVIDKMQDPKRGKDHQEGFLIFGGYALYVDNESSVDEVVQQFDNLSRGILTSDPGPATVGPCPECGLTHDELPATVQEIDAYPDGATITREVDEDGNVVLEIDPPTKSDAASDSVAEQVIDAICDEAAIEEMESEGGPPLNMACDLIAACDVNYMVISEPDFTDDVAVVLYKTEGEANEFADEQENGMMTQGGVISVVQVIRRIQVKQLPEGRQVDDTFVDPSTADGLGGTPGVYGDDVDV
jgi:hypothetical protein